ncbi:Hydroxyneurosporene synthase, partial [Penicillium canescens]
VVQDGDSKANFDIRTPTSLLDIETLFSLDAPQIDSINGTVFAGSVPATFATVAGRAPPHLPCGIHAEETTLKIAPHIGWVSLIPDAMAEADIEIQGSMLKFQGSGYHDKNWSDRPFLESVQSWYWGHGHIGPYSIAWFSYLAFDDPTNTIYVSSYIARDGELLVSTCDPNLLTVHPTGNPGTTGARYPPRVGDIPEGFRLEYDLGTEGQLNANVSIRAIVAGDGENYMRWTGDLVGEVIPSVGGPQEGRCDPDHKRDANKPIETQSPSSLTGVAVLEQFI